MKLSELSTEISLAKLAMATLADKTGMPVCDPDVYILAEGFERQSVKGVIVDENGNVIVK